MKDSEVLITALRGVLSTCRAGGMTRVAMKTVVDEVCNLINERDNKKHPEIGVIEEHTADIPCYVDEYMCPCDKDGKTQHYIKTKGEQNESFHE
jgi:hypothetical protein